MRELQSHHCMFGQIKHIPSAVHGHPQQSLNWSAGCKIASVLTFLTGASAKLKRGHVKRFAVALSVWGASRSRFCPGPRVHLIRHWTQARNQGRKGGEASPANFVDPPGKICWAKLKTVGHSLKNLGPSQKTLRPTWCSKLVTGLGKTVWLIGFFVE